MRLAHRPVWNTMTASASTRSWPGWRVPLKPTLEAVRRTILSADPAITEGVKWNSPSFYCHGWFATINSHKPTQIDVVFFCRTKICAGSSTVRQVIDDPEHLLTWPSKDRALLSFQE